LAGLDIEEALGKFSKLKILVFGDIVLDVERAGSAVSLAPEAPVPLVRIERENYHVGGAFNAVANAASLGVSTAIVSVVGDDDGGRVVASRLKELGCNTDGLIVGEGMPTATVERLIANNHMLLRVDKGFSSEPAEAVRDKAIDAYEKYVKSADAVVMISKYGNGILSKQTIDKAIEEAHKRGVEVFVNPRADSAENYAGSDFLRLSRNEASKITGIASINDTSVRNMLIYLKSHSQAKNVAITWLEDNSYLLDAANKLHIIKPLAAKPLEAPSTGLLGIGDRMLTVTAIMSASGYDKVVALKTAMAIAYLAAAKYEFGGSGELIKQLASDANLKKWLESE